MGDNLNYQIMKSLWDRWWKGETFDIPDKVNYWAAKSKFLKEKAKKFNIKSRSAEIHIVLSELF